MKTFVFLFLIFTSLPVSQTNGDDKKEESVNKYEVSINEYLIWKENYESEENLSINQVVIIDIDGYITRQVEIKEDIEISTPDILKPVINRAIFLTKIEGVYYYLCD